MDGVLDTLDFVCPFPAFIIFRVKGNPVLGRKTRAVWMSAEGASKG